MKKSISKSSFSCTKKAEKLALKVWLGNADILDFEQSYSTSISSARLSGLIEP